MFLSDNIRSVLDGKGWGVLSIAPEAFVNDAVREMARRDVGALAVIGSAGLIGILSERDCARGIILPGRPPEDTRVGEVMSHPVRTVTPDDTVEDCLRTTTIFRLHHLVVVSNGRAAGLVSTGDLVDWILSDAADVARQVHSPPKMGRSSTKQVLEPRSPLTNIQLI